jgi:pyruvyl transferase EpsO
VTDPEDKAAAAGAAEASARVVDGLARRIGAVLDPLLPPGEPYALLDFPPFPNVGDSAIWLGTLAYLRRRGLPPPRYTCDTYTFSPGALASRLPRGTILLCGGGNFGDLYRPNQELRERVASTMRDHRLIQLPQTIHFATPESLEQARRAFNGHPDVTLLVRSRLSLERARASFDAPAALCPDMALCLGPLPRPAPTVDVVWLSRGDKESATASAPPMPDGVHRSDWIVDSPSPALVTQRFLTRASRHRPALRPWIQPMLSGTYEAVARERLARGCALLGRGRSVITDRLHGHILSLLLGIPHVLLDNSYGKVRRFHEDWTHDSPLVRFAQSEAEALALARAPRTGSPGPS